MKENKYMNSLIQYIFKNKSNILLIICWTLIAWNLIPYHELWYDEIIPYHLINTFDFISLFKVLQGTEGHPPVWYLVQYPFVKLGYPIIIIQYLSFIFVFIAVCYFCFRSKFNFFIKFLILFSSGMLYLYPVIARNYSLIPIFIFILADLYPNRHNKPVLYSFILIILSQIHILLWPISFLCSVFFTFEFIKSYIKDNLYRDMLKSHIISIVALISDLIFTLWFFKFLISYQRLPAFNIDYNIIKDFILFIPTHLNLSGIYCYFFLFILMIYLLALLKLNSKLFLIIVSTIISFEFIFFVVYEIGGVPLQKIFIIFLLIIFSSWIIRDYKGTVKYIYDLSFMVLMIIMFFNPLSYVIIKDEINNSFCNLSILTYYFKNKLASDEHIFETGSTIFYNKYLTYIPRKQLYNIEIDDLPEVLDNEFIDNISIENNLNIKYLILYKKINYSLDGQYKLIYTSPVNKVTTFEIFEPLENDFVIYEKMK